MSISEKIKTNLAYGQELVESGVDGAKEARKTLLETPDAGDLITEAAQESWQAATIGVLAGAIFGVLTDDRKPLRGVITGGLLGAAAVRLRRSTRPHRAPARTRARSQRRAMAPLRVARERGRAHKVLAVDAARHDSAHQARALCQAAVARRAGLPGDEGRARPRSLRRPNLARLSPPRDVGRRRPRLPRAPTSAFPPGAQRSGRCPWCVGTCRSCCSAGSVSAHCVVSLSTSGLCPAAPHYCRDDSIR